MSFKKTLSSIALVGVLAMGGCSKEEPIPEQLYIKLQGTAFSERYMPASGSSFNAPDIQSRYSFSVDTEFGRKAVQVEPTREITIESIDALIEPGTKVEIELKQKQKDNQVYVVSADKIRVAK